MNRVIVAGLLVLLPWTSRAELIFVDYEGVVGSLYTEGEPILDFVLGQPIRGRVTIDTQLAGPDDHPGPQSGSYRNDGVDFIVGGPETRPFEIPGDSVFASPYAPKPDRYWQFFDGSVDGSNNSSSFSLTVHNLPSQILDDDIWQAFKAEPKKDGSRISSLLVRVKNGMQSGVQFFFDRVSVTPESCLAP